MDLNTATICYVRSLVPVLAAHGLTEARFLARLGIDHDALSNVDARIPRATVALAWELAAQFTRNDSVGLLASLHAPPGSFPVLDHIAANLPTVGDALRSIARYCRLCDGQLAMRFVAVPEGGRVSLAFPSADRGYSRHWSEWFIGLILSRARTLGDDPGLCPLAVSFQHQRPASDVSVAAVLGCRPAFSRSTTSITFAHPALARPIRDASRFLSGVLIAHAERDLRRFLPEDQLAGQIRRTMIDLLDREAPRLEAAARQLRCSVRTLQVRLQREGTSWAKLLDDVRRQLALQYIEDDSIRLIEIPLLLKFAEPSPFHRAFKRWTGKTPLEYRSGRRPVGRDLGFALVDRAAAVHR